MLTKNDIAQRSRIVPGAVSVTYRPANPVGAPFTVSGARKRALDGNEAMAFNMAVGFDTTFWILPAANMNGVVPDSGDVINDGSDDWIVTPRGVSGLMESEWKLACTKGRVNQ